jgi:hypothetical protein
MTHLTMEQLLALREPGLEPGVQALREHLDSCEVCSAELDRLDQRIARLRALPVLKPARSRLTEIQAQTHRFRFRRRLKLVGGSTLALAATITAAVVLVPAVERSSSNRLAEQQELDSIIARSRSLESFIQNLDPDRQVTDGRAAMAAASLEDRVARIDQQLQMINLREDQTSAREALRLWRTRIGLLDALVDVHTTGASYVRY